VISVPGGARELTMEAAAPVGVTMSEMPLGDVTHLLAELSAAGGSGANPGVIPAVERSYSASSTVGGAYVALLRELFAPLGIAVLDASHEAVRHRSAPLLKRALERGDDIAKAISANNAAIENAGHALQVQDVAGLSLVFENTASGRKRIPRKRGARDVAPDSDLGPNVLLRPIIERQILPTIAYAGGPAEIAYFAQLSPIAAALEVERPLIVPRWSCTIVEPHVRKILDELGVATGDFRDPHAVETKVARDKLPGDLQQQISELRAEIDERSVSLTGSLDVDSPLVGKSVVEGLRHNLAHRVDRFERRVVAASKSRHADLMHAAATARGSLFPLGRSQERTLSFVPFLARYGNQLQEAMLASASEHARSLL
ncbi:MAG: bacillithiol biosynthesis cysteine-adding enzyme BshC, partial [Gemmatimonadota bacterium]|nr:bacillithiol biosynthesis cysteine-adding enzyme BshC [Gemmatimonadota bacterium]